MKLLLVGPEREENLSLRYLSASLLAAGHGVSIAAFDSLADLERVVEQARGVDAVGLSLCFQVRAREFLSLAATLKLYAPRVPIVAGGHYATCAADELLAHHPDLDVVVLHEGELTLVELAEAGFDPARFPSIKGLAYREADTIRRSAPRPKLAELDTLPFPDRRGPVRRHAGIPTAYLMGSRGCYSSCDYCCIATLHRTAPGPRFRQRSVENVADEMASLHHERSVSHFVFHDDNFLVPSVAENHRRLDALSAALAARRVGRIGFTIKCRPSEVDRGVFQKLVRMGLLRVFLGIESGSPAGLASIGRHGCQGGREADMLAAEAALDLCQELGISVQYTLMCFHPDATPETVERDLEFFRRHSQFALNFCRVESYAGTPLEARLRASGRGKGDYLARTYTISDPSIEVASRLAMRIFRRRCWMNDSLMELTIGLDHLAEVLRHYYGGPGVEDARTKVRAFTERVNHALIELLSEVVRIAVETKGYDDPLFRLRMRQLVERERRNNDELLAEGHALRTGISELDRRPTPSSGNRHIALARTPRLLRTAATLALAATLLGCSSSDQSEYAPAPLEDSDGDGLPDQCETEIFGTDPTLVDTDANGIADGEENHDGGSMTNRQEQSAAGTTRCADAQDSISEAAPTPLVDTDGDGLPDQCELEIFGTDPVLVDTDNDGVDDGSENHDGGSMNNLQEQSLTGSTYCADAQDSMSEAAPTPLVDTDGDGLPDQCELEIFGTDPALADTDSNGVLDGKENHDGGTMTNLQEQAQGGGIYGCEDAED
jgi:anaerobic magnesium-protoporphyrin IX monomethyl ester cyclase